jgi:glycerol-3-phosphate dehydrogenase
MSNTPSFSAQQSGAETRHCDLLIIGGGINGAGIARDAAGRGLSVVLCERDDLAQHTSSASTKLVHGGLRYLEYYEFGLVRKALREREVLLRAAPHIISPLRFVMPHEAKTRPAWMIRAGLFLYDHLAKRKFLPASTSIKLSDHVAGMPLKGECKIGFVYSDGWVDDARLVVLNALDAHEHGAKIFTHTSCTDLRRDGNLWHATLVGQHAGTVTARAVVNAAGPWAAQVAALAPGQSKRNLRLVKGSHIVVPRLFQHSYAYLFQNTDKRIVFAIPYQDEFTLIGTTDLEYTGDPATVAIQRDEVDYLCDIANQYFRKQISKDDVVWTYSGVRPLLDDSAQNASAVTRDYLLECESDGPPLLNIWGGKITTYRKLAEEALAMILPRLDNSAPIWTSQQPLPGGDLDQAGALVRSAAFDGFFRRVCQTYPWLPAALAKRYAHAYGSRIHPMLAGVSSLEELGKELSPGLFELEAKYLCEVEWASSSADILWRRTKLGLYGHPEHVIELDDWLNERTHAQSKNIQC